VTTQPPHDYVPPTRRRRPKSNSALLLTAEQVAELLNMSSATVRRLAASSAIPHVRVGALLRFRHGDVEAFVSGLPTLGWRAPPEPPRRTGWGQATKEYTIGEWVKGWGIDRLRLHRPDLYELVQAGTMREIDAVKQAARDLEERKAQRAAAAAKKAAGEQAR
jgi:excisionase family DNA binding protein